MRKSMVSSKLLEPLYRYKAGSSVAGRSKSVLADLSKAIFLRKEGTQVTELRNRKIQRNSSLVQIFYQNYMF